MSLRLITLLIICPVIHAIAQQEIAPAGHAEPPHWPVGLRLPMEFLGDRPEKNPNRAHVLLWLPPSPVRAVLLIPENSDSKYLGEHAPLREMAGRQGLAIVYLRARVRTGVEDQPQPAAPELLPRLLEHFADQTGEPALRYAPFIALGKSSRGRFPYRVAWLHPARTVATITYHGETPPYPEDSWAEGAGFAAMHLNVNGETEWGGTWYRHVRPALLNHRARHDWPVHQVVVPGVGHGDYPDEHGKAGWAQPFPDRVTCVEVWDYITLFMERALAQRLPPGPLPTGRAPVLLPVVTEKGWLIRAKAVESLLGLPARPLVRGADGFFLVDPPPGPSTDALVRPASAVSPDEPILCPARDVAPEARTGWFWCPDEALARAWLRLHTPRSPSR